MNLGRAERGKIFRVFNVNFSNLGLKNMSEKGYYKEG